MKNIKKLQNQIKVLNKKLQLKQVKNTYAVMGKINKLKDEIANLSDKFVGDYKTNHYYA